MTVEPKFHRRGEIQHHRRASRTARADSLRGDEERPVPGETLEDAEDELGMNTWVDEESGEVEDGQSPPHLPRP